MGLFSALDWLQWVGCVFGLAGSLMLPLNRPWSGWGFVPFLISNVFWGAFAIATQSNGLLVMQVGFVVANVVGVCKWLVPAWSKSKTPKKSRATRRTN